MTALPIYEFINTKVVKGQYDDKNKEKIGTRKHTDFSTIIGAVSKKESVPREEYTPRIAYERANLVTNLKQSVVINNDYEEFKHNLKLCRYKFDKNKSVFVQKHVFSSLDIETILDRIDQINNENKGLEPKQLKLEKQIFSQPKQALRYNNYKKGNYERYGFNLDVLVG